MPKELACRECRALTTGKKCPVCGSTNLTENWSGVVIILDPENSEVAKMMGVAKPGRYAVEVR